MRRAALAGALALGGVLAGCPLPQPLPDYPSSRITPPRILTDDLLEGNGAVIFIPANCTSFVRELSANVVDTNTIESIDARWFVNYDVRLPVNRTPQQQSTIPPNADTSLERAVPPFRFEPYTYPPAYGTPGSTTVPNPNPDVLRVVELVVSNGFDAAADQASLEWPFRSKLSGFETQVHRWVFMTTTAVPCP